MIPLTLESIGNKGSIIVEIVLHQEYMYALVYKVWLILNSESSSTINAYMKRSSNNTWFLDYGSIADDGTVFISTAECMS